jgi:ankyrin repeat protein
MALQAASDSGHLDIVQLLVENGADVNGQGGCVSIASCSSNTILEGGKYGTALQAASDSGHVQIVEFLLQRGANPNVQGQKPFDSGDIVLI